MSNIRDKGYREPLYTPTYVLQSIYGHCKYIQAKGPKLEHGHEIGTNVLMRHLCSVCMYWCVNYSGETLDYDIIPVLSSWNIKVYDTVCQIPWNYHRVKPQHPTFHCLNWFSKWVAVVCAEKWAQRGGLNNHMYWGSHLLEWYVNKHSAASIFSCVFDTSYLNGF